METQEARGDSIVFWEKKRDAECEDTESECIGKGDESE